MLGFQMCTMPGFCSVLEFVFFKTSLKFRHVKVFHYLTINDFHEGKCNPCVYNSSQPCRVTTLKKIQTLKPLLLIQPQKGENVDSAPRSQRWSAWSKAHSLKTSREEYVESPWESWNICFSQRIDFPALNSPYYGANNNFWNVKQNNFRTWLKSTLRVMRPYVTFYCFYPLGVTQILNGQDETWLPIALYLSI